MPTRDVIVVGGSAGAVEVLKTLAAGLPVDLPAAVLVVLHMAPSSPSVLPALLQRGCALPVAFAADGEPLAPGRVYLAPPDRHLVVEPGTVRVTRAPRENHSRPAVDPLFRSAALAYGPRVVGCVLSGRLDDGTAGLWAVKDHGGTAVVQDPDDARHADMPRNALEHTAADHVVRAAELAPLLARLARTAAAGQAPATRELEPEVRIAMGENALQSGVLGLGPPSPYTCPDCHGVLLRIDEGSIARFRCHTGHAYSFDSLLAASTELAEATLWSAMRAVEESAMLLREAAERGRAGRGDPAAAADRRLEELARETAARAETIRQAVLHHRALSLEGVRAEAEPERGGRGAGLGDGRAPAHDGGR